MWRAHKQTNNQSEVNEKNKKANEQTISKIKQDKNITVSSVVSMLYVSVLEIL